MPDAPTSAAPADRPEPQARPVAVADPTRRPGYLLGLVRKLIDYGTKLATTLQQHVAATGVAVIFMQFGTNDVTQILARIMRGLRLAAALEARLIDRPPSQEKEPPAAATSAPSSPRQPRAASPAARSVTEANPRLAKLPSAEDIAAEIRHRPTGAVLADICRDLGILPSDPLWRELFMAIMVNRGNPSAVVIESIKRMTIPCDDPYASIIPPMPPGWQPPPLVSFAEVFGTGPP